MDCAKSAEGTETSLMKYGILSRTLEANSVLENGQRGYLEGNLNKNNITSSRNNITLDRNNITLDRNNITLDRNNITSDRNNITLDRNNITSESNNLKGNHLEINPDRNNITLSTLERKDSMASFFHDTRSNPLDIISSPTLLFSKRIYETQDFDKSLDAKLFANIEKGVMSPARCAFPEDQDERGNLVFTEPYMQDEVVASKYASPVHNFYKSSYNRTPTPTKVQDKSTPTLNLTTPKRESSIMRELSIMRESPTLKEPSIVQESSFRRDSSFRREPSFMQQSSINDSPVPHDPSIRREPTLLRESSIRESSVRESSIRDPSIRDPSIRDSSIRDSSIRDSSIKDPSIRDSSIRDSPIRDSSISSLKEATTHTNPEKTLQDNFFVQFNDGYEDLMHESMPSYDNSITRTLDKKISLNLESLLKSINIDLSEEFPYAFKKENVLYYLQRGAKYQKIENIILTVLPKISYTENECLRLQKLISECRSKISDLVAGIEENPPPILYELSELTKDSNELAERLRTTHIHTVNEAEVKASSDCSESISVFQRHMSQVLSSAQSDEKKIKFHQNKLREMTEMALKCNTNIKDSILNIKKQIEEKKNDQKARKSELLKTSKEKYEYLKSLMDKEAVSQSGINDSSEEKKIKIEIEHLRDCVSDLNKEYTNIKNKSPNRLRHLSREYSALCNVLPWNVASSTKQEISLVYMSSIEILAKNKGSKCSLEFQLLPAEARRGSDFVIEKIGAHLVSKVLKAIREELYPNLLEFRDLKRSMLTIEQLWLGLAELCMDFEALGLRHDSCIVSSAKNALGLKIEHVFKDSTLSLIFWRVYHENAKSGLQYEMLDGLSQSGSEELEEAKARLLSLDSNTCELDSLSDIVEYVIACD